MAASGQRTGRAGQERATRANDAASLVQGLSLLAHKRRPVELVNNAGEWLTPVKEQSERNLKGLVGLSIMMVMCSQK